MKTDLLKNSEIFVFLALVFSIFTASLLSNEAALNKEGDQLGYEIDSLTDKYKKCKDSLNGFKKSYGNLEKKYKGCIDSLKKRDNTLGIYKERIIILSDSLEKIVSKYSKTPPHIEIKGTERFFFDKGSSTINDDFKAFIIDSIVPKLNILLKNCKRCNAIYIVGHTDGVNATQYRNNNFDENVVQVINNGNFKYYFNSNTDLGIQRAFSIYSLLKKRSDLKQIKYWFPFSAGPFIDPNSGQLITYLSTDDDKTKRRIEIWVYAYKH